MIEQPQLRKACTVKTAMVGCTDKTAQQTWLSVSLGRLLGCTTHSSTARSGVRCSRLRFTSQRKDIKRLSAELLCSCDAFIPRSAPICPEYIRETTTDRLTTLTCHSHLSDSLPLVRPCGEVGPPKMDETVAGPTFHRKRGEVGPPLTPRTVRNRFRRP